jgi:hypothetical protein
MLRAGGGLRGILRVTPFAEVGQRRLVILV